MDQVDAAYLAEYLQQSGSGSGSGSGPGTDGDLERTAAAELETRLSLADIQAEAADRLGRGDAAFDTQLLVKLYNVRAISGGIDAAAVMPGSHREFWPPTGVSPDPPLTHTIPTEWG